MTPPVTGSGTDKGPAPGDPGVLDFSVNGTGVSGSASLNDSGRASISGSIPESGTTGSVSASGTTGSIPASGNTGSIPAPRTTGSLSLGPAASGSGSSTDHLHQAPTDPPVRLGKRSRFLHSFLIFLFINAILTFTAPIDFDPYRYPYRGWPFWMFNDLRHDPATHNVMLLGSSLMVSAVAGCDANYLQKSLDLTSYHKASYLDDLLHKKFGGVFSTVNLSAPGQMPSDAYLTLKATVDIAQRPDVVIYGIAPRDFIDSMLSNAAETESFKYIERIVNVDDVASGFYRTPLPRLEWLLQRSLYLCGHSLDLQMFANDGLSMAISYVVPRPQVTAYPFTWWNRRKLLPTYLAGEIVPNSMLAMPVSRADVQKQYSDNTAEYRERYKHPVPGIYQTQLYFLRKLAAYCRREKIELILVNMPITELNVSLLRPLTYQQFVSGMQVFGFSQDIPLLDLCDWTKFKMEDFHDTVHLNAFGGRKLFDSLVDHCAKNLRARRALKLAGIQMQASEALELADQIDTSPQQPSSPNTPVKSPVKPPVKPSVKSAPSRAR